MSPIWLAFLLDAAFAISIFGSKQITDPNEVAAAAAAAAARLEAAAQANAAKFEPVDDRQDSNQAPASDADAGARKLNDRKKDDEPAASAESAEPSALNVKRLEESKEEPVQASSEEPVTQSKFTLKKSTDDAAVEEVAQAEPAVEVTLPTEAPPAAHHSIFAGAEKKAEKKNTKKEKMVMGDMPHYRNHGAAFEHVEPTRKVPEKKAPSGDKHPLNGAKRHAEKRAEEEAKRAEQKAAEQRAEVEDIFHVSKKSSEAKSSSGFGFMRSFLLFGALLAAGFAAYHKSQELLQLAGGGKGGLPQFGGKGGLPQFNSKKDDDYKPMSFGQLPSSMGGRRQHVSHDSEFGV